MSNFYQAELHHLYDGGIQSASDPECECGNPACGILNGRYICAPCLESASDDVAVKVTRFLDSCSEIELLALRSLWDDLYTEYLEELDYEEI